MRDSKKARQFVICCCACVAAISSHVFSSPQDCTYNGNEICRLLCAPGSGDNPFCPLENLQPVLGTDRVIWDGSFSHSDSGFDGPGGRWVGHTTQSKWDPKTREVRDGELVLRGGIDEIHARVFGQSFGEAATYGQQSVNPVDVIVTTNDVIRLSFTASFVNGPNKDCSMAWVMVRLGAPNPDWTPDSPGWEDPYLTVDRDIDQAGHGVHWFINYARDVDLHCELDLDLSEVDSEDCFNSIDISDWIPMIQFCVWMDGGGVQYENIELHIDDIEMNVVEGPYTDPKNLEERPETCGHTIPADFKSWTFITDDHWSGGGPDNTTGIAARPSACFADINNDGAVNVGDLLAVISGWGPLGEFNSDADINCDENVNVEDLLLVLSGWGTLCP